MLAVLLRREAIPASFSQTIISIDCFSDRSERMVSFPHPKSIKVESRRKTNLDRLVIVYSKVLPMADSIKDTLKSAV